MSTEAQRKAILENQAAREAESGIKAQRLVEAARQERAKRRIHPFSLPDYDDCDDGPGRRKRRC